MKETSCIIVLFSWSTVLKCTSLSKKYTFLFHSCLHWQVVKSVLLFPTIERMAQTPQGKVMTPVLCHLRYITYLPIFLLSLLPETLKAAIVKLIFGGLRSLDHTVIPATVSLFSVDCAGEWLASCHFL